MADVNAEGPRTTDGLRVGSPPDTSGGIPAIASAMRHTMAEMGLVRGAKMLLKVNQADGFDCPGCAWPEPEEHRSAFEFCENGAKAVAEEATTRRVTPEFFAQWSVDALTAQSDMWLGKQGRLTHPLVLRPGASHYEPVSWNEAFTIIAGELHTLASPDEALFYTSGRTSNEAAFLYQLFARLYGTNNLPDCSNMCHESSGTALSETIGVGKGTVSLRDFALADAIFIIGQNPGTNHPRMLTTLQQAARRGCPIVSINPLREAGLTHFKHPQEVLGLVGKGTQLASHFVQVRINGDVAFFQGVIKELLDEEEEPLSPSPSPLQGKGGEGSPEPTPTLSLERRGSQKSPYSVIDWEFIRAYTDGFEEMVESIRRVEWDRIVAASGVSREQIREVAEVVMRSKRMICCWAMGLTQHKNAVDNIQEIVNLLLLRGQIGIPGAGVCPVRGHSNVQGDRTMGISEKMGKTFLDNLAREFDFESPRHHGLDTVGATHAMRDGKASVLIGMGGNFLSATPDTAATAAALRNCRLTVHISTKLNRSHLVTGRQALILPCLGRTDRDIQAGGEQFVTVEDSMSMVHMSRGSLAPPSTDVRSEPWIVANLAKAVLTGRGAVDWDSLVADYDKIRDHIARVVPGCEEYNKRVRKPGGFQLPNGARERTFRTPTGKARFTVHEIPPNPLGPGQYLMMTIRSHDQYNTTIYGLDDRYRGIANGRRVVLMNARDIVEGGLKDGQVVDLVSHFEGRERIAREFVVVPYDIPRRCTATYFPEANVLVPLESVADKSNTPTSKSVVITVHAGGGGGGEGLMIATLEQTAPISLADGSERSLQQVASRSAMMYCIHVASFRGGPRGST